MPRMSKTGHDRQVKGIQRAQQDHQHGARHAGHAFAGEHQREDITSCWPKLRWMPAAWATKIDASER